MKPVGPLNGRMSHLAARGDRGRGCRRYSHAGDTLAARRARRWLGCRRRGNLYASLLPPSWPSVLLRNRPFAPAAGNRPRIMQCATNLNILARRRRTLGGIVPSSAGHANLHGVIMA